MSETTVNQIEKEIPKDSTALIKASILNRSYHLLNSYYETNSIKEGWDNIMQDLIQNGEKSWIIQQLQNAPDKNRFFSTLATINKFVG